MEAASGTRSGIKWTEIFRVTACKYDLMGGRVGICLTFDFDYGEFFEVWDSQPGFDGFIEAISLRLADADRTWLGKVKDSAFASSSSLMTSIPLHEPALRLPRGRTVGTIFATG
jgi:hypothetical protein